MWVFHIIPSLQLVARQYNNILKHILPNNIIRFREVFLSMCSFQYLQQQIPVLYNDFTTIETICIALQSLFVHCHLKTDCWVFAQHFVGQMHKEYCCLNEMIHMFVLISVYLSVIFDQENNYAILYLQVQHKCGHSIPYHSKSPFYCQLFQQHS